MPKQDKEDKAPAEIVNNSRRQAMRKLAYTPPTLISLGLINQATACGSPGGPPPPPGGCP
jgi:hypothetical protein